MNDSSTPPRRYRSTSSLLLTHMCEGDDTWHFAIFAAEEHEQVKDFFIATGSPSRDNGFGMLKQQHPEKNINGSLHCVLALADMYGVFVTLWPLQTATSHRHWSTLRNQRPAAPAQQNEPSGIWASGLRVSLTISCTRCSGR